MRHSTWYAPAGPTGMNIAPPTPSWASRGGGTWSGEAVPMMASKDPLFAPCPDDLDAVDLDPRLHHHRGLIAEPVPISRTRTPGGTFSSCAIKATIWASGIVYRQPMEGGWVSTASSRNSLVTKW
jgi:hypothetical protein